MDLSANTWSTVSRLLDEALELEAPARTMWLVQLTAREPQLATVVERMLAAHAASETNDVLAALPTVALPTLLPWRQAPGLSLLTAQPSALREGDRVGPYRLIRELGVGGMAHVWLAARADGAFERDIALKLPQISLLRRHLAERFARERDILARLEHPHIARLYDAGVAADGTPYLAMEFVAGQSIHTYCDQRKLDLTARLALFDQVLAAVQYAHANLVIHRDLKPSNILVDDSGADGMGQVRLLDFGIAKLVADDERAHETQLTALSGRAMTPDYASPEQILGEPLTIASDVYSLGVVLFELLTGARPYKLKLKSTAHLELAILDAEAASPSSALTPEAAAARGATVARLARALRGDLDTIVRKALAKQPADRYLTIAEFADDLRRLRDGQTVLARPPSWSYRSRKFVTRNRLGVGAAAAVAIALLAGTAVSLWQAQRAVEQANVARREAQRAEAVQNFVLDIFRANSDKQKDPARARNATARELLDLGTERLESALQDAPESRAVVMRTLADMYYQLQLDAQASAIEERRIALLRQLHGRDDRSVAEALISLAASLHATGRRGEILPALEEAERILDVNGDRKSRLRGELLTRLAQRHQNISLEKMLAYADEAVRVLRPHQVINEDRLSTALHLAARARVQTGDFAGGETLYRESIAELRKSSPVPQVAVQQALVALAESLAGQQKFDEAVATYREAATDSRKLLGAGDPGPLVAESRLAALLHATGQREEARSLHEATLKAMLALRGADDTLFTPIARMDYGRSLLAEGRLPLAQDLVSKVNASNRVHYAGSGVLGQGLRTEALVALARGRHAEARQLFAEGFATWTKGAGVVHPSRHNRFHLDEARLDLVMREPQRAIERLAAVVPPAHVERLLLRNDEVERDVLLARAWQQRGDLERAGALAAAALRAIEGSPAQRHFPALEAEAAQQLGLVQLAGGDAGGARVRLERALALRTALEDPRSPALAESQLALAACLQAQGEAQRAQTLTTRAQAILAVR